MLLTLTKWRSGNRKSSLLFGKEFIFMRSKGRVLAVQYNLQICHSGNGWSKVGECDTAIFDLLSFHVTHSFEFSARLLFIRLQLALVALVNPVKHHIHHSLCVIFNTSTLGSSKCTAMEMAQQSTPVNVMPLSCGSSL